VNPSRLSDDRGHAFSREAQTKTNRSGSSAALNFEMGAISIVRMTIMRDRSKVLYPRQLSNNFQHRMPAGAG